MKYRVRLTALAEQDVKSIIDWLNERSMTAGGRWFAQLTAAIETLEINPHRLPFATEPVVAGLQIRERLVGRGRHKYRLLVRIDGDLVSVLRVWHSARDAFTADELVDDR